MWIICITFLLLIHPLEHFVGRHGHGFTDQACLSSSCKLCPFVFLPLSQGKSYGRLVMIMVGLETFSYFTNYRLGIGVPPHLGYRHALNGQ